MAGYKGRQGRKPLPTSVKVLRGNPGKRPLSDGEPRPEATLPAPPSHLSAEAKREWQRLGRQLVAMGLMTKIDRAALAMYCQAWARWLEAEKALKAYGVMVKSPNGFPMQSPYLAVANKAMEQIRAMLTEFGMSPSSRTRVHVTPQVDEEDEMERFVRKRLTTLG
jgi:P27 family predicted phage terminase small subunit